MWQQHLARESRAGRPYHFPPGAEDSGILALFFSSFGDNSHFLSGLKLGSPVSSVIRKRDA
jgi:hypothetical protein